MSHPFHAWAYVALLMALQLHVKAFNVWWWRVE
jgi:hypothetical protein